MFRQAIDFCKSVLEAAKIAYVNETESITSLKVGSWDFWWNVNSVLNKGKSAIAPLLNLPKVLSSASYKAKLLAKNLRTLIIDDSGISLPAFPSRTNLKLHNISATPKIF